MVTTLVLVRHAKADPPDHLPDRERPLTGRGRRDAVAAGRWLRSLGTVPQVAVVSTARRTHETYELIAGELAEPPRPQLTDEAYAASAGQLLDLVRELPPEASSALVVAHNPGIGTLATLLDGSSTAAGEFATDRREPSAEARLPAGYPTSAVAVLEFDGSWVDLAVGAGRLTAFTVARG